jgi:hypothetical protein
LFHLMSHVILAGQGIVVPIYGIYGPLSHRDPVSDLPSRLMGGASRIWPEMPADDRLGGHGCMAGPYIPIMGTFIRNLGFDHYRFIVPISRFPQVSKRIAGPRVIGAIIPRTSILMDGMERCDAN